MYVLLLKVYRYYYHVFSKNYLNCHYIPEGAFSFSHITDPGHTITVLRLCHNILMLKGGPRTMSLSPQTFL